jgi:hypothetical protein
MKKQVSINDVAPLIESVVSRDGKFRLYPKGISMRPLLREGKDSVLLEKCTNIEKNDILLYKRPSGQYVLHRTVSVENNLVFCGDNQSFYEYGITENDIIAKVCGIYRKEKFYDLKKYNFKLYLFFIKFRRKVKNKVKRIIKRFLKGKKKA